MQVGETVKASIVFKRISESRLVGVVAATSLLLFVVLPVLMLAAACTVMYLAIQSVRRASASSGSLRVE